MPVSVITPGTLKEWLARGEAVVVDVREPAEHRARHIRGAVLLPSGCVCGKDMPKAHGKKLVIHCHSGKRGAAACEKLLAESPDLQLYHLDGGISAWAAEGLPVVEAGFFLPLDRQVQLTVGLGIMFASAAAYILDPRFALLSGFFGAGLTFAGATGFCGLARLLARMPWNQRG